MDDLVQQADFRREIAEHVAEDSLLNLQPFLLIDADELGELAGMEGVGSEFDEHG